MLSGLPPHTAVESIMPLIGIFRQQRKKHGKEENGMPVTLNCLGSKEFVPEDAIHKSDSKSFTDHGS